MLIVDLRRLAREGRVRVQGPLALEDALWEGVEPRPVEPPRVDLEVQKAGADVVARGSLEGVVELPCRRCLEPVRGRVNEDLTFLYRASAQEDDEESYALPRQAHELDLGPAVREHWLLAAPHFLECSRTCRGLCPRCGMNWNQGECDCAVEEVDDRWGPLLRLKRE